MNCKLCIKLEGEKGEIRGNLAQLKITPIKPNKREDHSSICEGIVNIMPLTQKMIQHLLTPNLTVHTPTHVLILLNLFYFLFK